jgi:hypothetical protein
MIDPTQASSWIMAGKSGLELLRSAWAVLPRSDEKDRIARKLEEAESALELSNAKLAKDLGQNVTCGRVDSVERPIGAKARRRRA